MLLLKTAKLKVKSVSISSPISLELSVEEWQSRFPKAPPSLWLSTILFPDHQLCHGRPPSSVLNAKLSTLVLCFLVKILPLWRALTPLRSVLKTASIESWCLLFSLNLLPILSGGIKLTLSQSTWSLLQLENSTRRTSLINQEFTQSLKIWLIEQLLSSTEYLNSYLA
jgi:hypothetical protein